MISTAITCLLWLFCLTSPTTTFRTSLDLTPNITHPLFPRQCRWFPPGRWKCDYKLPTLAEIRYRMQDTSDSGKATADKTLWFYTGFGPYDAKKYSDIFRDCYAYMTRACLQHYSVGDALNRDWQNEQNNWMETNYDKMDFEKPDEVFSTCYYQGLSVSVRSEDVYVFVPREVKTAEWRQDSDWEQVEYWALTWNPAVKNIYRADNKAAHNDPNGKQLLWTSDALMAATKNIPTGKMKPRKVCKTWPKAFLDKNGVPTGWPF